MTDTKTTRRKRRMAREPQADTVAAAKDAAPPAKKQNKTEAVVALLKRKDGATLDELIKATGWLPHTARAALTGLRKKGHAIERTKVEGVSRYAIVEPVSQ